MNTLNDYGFDNTLLKTIHIPTNLNQLSDLLPKSKYEEDKPVLQPQKQHFERSKSTQKMVERVSSKDRRGIIDIANTIKLPPIKEDGTQSVLDNYSE